MDAIEAREIKENVLRIMALAMEVSKIREYPYEGDLPDVFVYFYANVSKLNVTVYENGYTASAEPDRKWEVYLYRDDTPDESKERYDTYGYADLDDIIEYLEDLKNGKF